MFKLIAENKYGQQLELTNNEAYEITNIDGLDPPDSVINTTRNAYADGSVYNSAYIDNRKITITMSINSPAETNRIELYRYFKTKFPVRLYYQNETRNVYIDGYVQSMPIAFFDKKQVVQIVVFCPKPLFNGVENTVTTFSNVVDLFEFPFSIPVIGIEFSELTVAEEKDIINHGDIETGMIIQLHADGPVVNPTIYNVETNEFFILEVTMTKGDEITINTRNTEKSIMLTSADGTQTNLIGSLKEGSTWFKLAPGDNIFTATAGANPQNLDAVCIIQDQFEGV